MSLTRLYLRWWDVNNWPLHLKINDAGRDLNAAVWHMDRRHMSGLFLEDVDCYGAEKKLQKILIPSR